MRPASNVIALRAPMPTIENGKVAPRPAPRAAPPARRRNADVRPREYLRPDEVDKLMKTAGATGRHGQRDAALILITYRHGLRVSELVALRWDMVDMKAGMMHVARLKGGIDSTHPLRGPELRALRAVKRAYPESPYVFSTERGGPMTTATVRKMIARAGLVAEIAFPVHPHMLRHGCGYTLANAGHDTRALQHYMGHASITNTVIYTAMAPDRFKGFWRD